MREDVRRVAQPAAQVVSIMSFTCQLQEAPVFSAQKKTKLAMLTFSRTFQHCQSDYFAILEISTLPIQGMLHLLRSPTLSPYCGELRSLRCHWCQKKKEKKNEICTALRSAQWDKALYLTNGVHEKTVPEPF